ncbi:hypothetical protein QR680_017856 [Steinernema hermaphroditum]|uniref:Uncharacterized protein n=1 Tax=Steinernema hermaphroditum TaxID=289476 RepID=A0AA39HIG4_9BILA|nr:hypothetical protein QR680_017856 [Steinernema hermaphroditum]
MPDLFSFVSELAVKLDDFRSHIDLLRNLSEYKEHVSSIPNDFALLSNNIIYDVLTHTDLQLLKKKEPCQGPYPKLLEIEGAWGDYARKSIFSLEINKDGAACKKTTFSPKNGHIERQVEIRGGLPISDTAITSSVEGVKDFEAVAPSLYQKIEVEAFTQNFDKFLNLFGNRFSSVAWLLIPECSEAQIHFLQRQKESRQLRKLSMYGNTPLPPALLPYAERFCQKPNFELLDYGILGDDYAEEYVFPNLLIFQTAYEAWKSTTLFTVSQKQISLHCGKITDAFRAYFNKLPIDRPNANLTKSHPTSPEHTLEVSVNRYEWLSNELTVHWIQLFCKATVTE